MKTRASFLKNASHIGLWTAASRMTGFMREMLTANILGVGPVVDALVLALKLPAFLRRLTAEGTVNSCLIPIFTKLVTEKGEAEAKRFASSILTITMAFLFVATGLFLIFTPTILGSIFSGLLKTPERFEMAIAYARIIFPFVILISATAIYGGVLNALGRFGAFASSPFFGNSFILVFILTSSFLGFLSGKPPIEQGFFFAWAILLCGVVQLIVVMADALRSGHFFLFRWPQKTKAIRSFFLRLGPAALGSGIAQVNLLVGLLIASWLPSGSISYLNYADRLIQLPLSVIGTALGVALLPALSKAIYHKKKGLADAQQEAAVTTALIVSSLVVIVVTLLSSSLVFLTFRHGKFSLNDVYQTARALSAYAWGLPAYMLSKILATRFFAKGRMAPPLWAGLTSLIIDIILSLLLIKPLGHVGIALASSLSAWVGVGVLTFLLHKNKEWSWPGRLIKLGGVLLALSIGIVSAIKIVMKTYCLPCAHFGQCLTQTFLIGLAIIGLFLLGMRAFAWKSLKLTFQKLRTEAA